MDFEIRTGNKQIFIICVFSQVKSKPRAAAPSTGPALQLQPPQPTSSGVSSLANAVRIEKLSDDENEEIDITDDLSDDGDNGDNPQAVVKDELCDSEQLSASAIQTDIPTEEQKKASLAKAKTQLSHSSPSPQSPHPSSSLACPEKTCVTELDEKVSLAPNQSGTPRDLQPLAKENESPSSQYESSALTVPLEEACSDGTGKAAVDGRTFSLYFSYTVAVFAS